MPWKEIQHSTGTKLDAEKQEPPMQPSRRAMATELGCRPEGGRGAGWKGRGHRTGAPTLGKEHWKGKGGLDTIKRNRGVLWAKSRKAVAADRSQVPGSPWRRDQDRMLHVA